MPTFQLFHCRVTLPSQIDLLRDPPSRPEIIRQALEERPSAELRKGYTWHIGNLESIGSDGIYFAFGKTTVTSIEQYDAVGGDFVEIEFDTAPYTHVILDLHHQVMAIAAKSRLAPTTGGISRQLTKLLNRSEAARIHEVQFNVAEIKDPQDLIKHLHESYAVCRFKMTFTRPNPFDANEDVQKPLEKFLAAANGRSGSTEVAGENLEPDILEELVRSAAASGNDAVAHVKPTQASRPVKKQLSGNPVIVSAEEPANDERKSALLDLVKSTYERVRRRLARNSDETELESGR